MPSPVEALRQQLMESKAVAVDLRHVAENETTFYIDELVDFITAYAATVDREAAKKAELYGRLHQTIELFQSGKLSAEAYSKLHESITARLAALQGPQA